MLPDEILIKDYDSIVRQIIHWDSHFWHKNQFFLAIQSAFMVVVLKVIKEKILNVPEISLKEISLKEILLKLDLLFLFTVVTFFNIYLCWVWFKTNRRNREYLELRMRRAREIEADSRLQGLLRTFRKDKRILHRNPFKKHGSAGWENHIPCGFIALWLVLLGFVFYKYLMSINFLNFLISIINRGING